MKKEYLVVDIGCGSNPPEHNSDSTMTIGVDIQRENVEGFISEGNAEGVQADIRHLPFGPDSIDKIRARHVLEHLKEPIGSLKEAHRVLKRGAKLVVAVPHHGVDSLVCCLNKEYRGMHKSRFTPKKIKNLVEQSGFNIKSVEKGEWIRAAGLIGLTLWNILSSNHEFVSHAGIKADDPTSNKLRINFYKAGRVLERIPGLNMIMNKIFPNETVIKAIKL